jgi:radical SAM superfamily enzyme YgiQ (UPF0313 family)
MEVFFISPSINLGVWVNYGIACLCGIIKEKGHHAELYQPVKFDINEFYGRFSQKHYALCLVSTVTNQWPYALKYIKALRKVSQIPIIVGGHHVTCCPDVIDENPEIDGICIGEGDIALGALLDRMVEGKEYHDLKNMWFRREHEIIQNEIGDLIQDLDALPFPDYSVFSAQAISGRPSILLSRGCPYNCTYCCNNSLRRLYSGKGKYVRKKSVKRALEEVQDFIDRYEPNRISFDDDTFVKDKKWLLEFLEEYRHLTDIPFDCNSRPETLDDEICSALKAAHCETLCVGIESGNEQFRKNVLHRDMTNESIVRAFSLLRKHGIKSYAFNIVGAPGDTYENYLETVRLNQAIRPDGYQITIFYPYPGSDLFNRAKEMGLLTNNTFRDSFVSKSLLRMKQFPRWKISFAKNTFGYRLWSGDKTFRQRTAYVLNCFSGGRLDKLMLFLGKLRIREK